MTDLISIQDATENCQNPQLVVELMRLELNFTFPQEHFFEITVLGERMSLVAVDKFGVVRKNYLEKMMFLSSNYSTVYHYSNKGYHGSFPSDYVPTPHNDTFAILKMQFCSMQGGHCMKIANTCH